MSTSDCESTPALRASYYVGATRLISSPHFARVDSSDAAPSSSSPLSSVSVTAANEHYYDYTDENGQTRSLLLVGDLAQPIFASSSRNCSGIISQVKFTIGYNSTSGSLTSATVQFHFGSVAYAVSGNDAIFEQTFDARFSAAPVQDNANLVFRSGNPGYIGGHPILSARVDADLQNSTMPVESLRFPGRDVNGLCSIATSHKARFGEDLQLFCFIQPNSTEACNNLRAQIELLNAQLPSRKSLTLTRVSFVD